MNETRTLQDWLRAAYAGEESGCPPPEAFLEGEASPEERRRLDEHADRCPACAAERDLARTFDDPEAAGLPAGDVDFVVSRLKEALPVRPAGQVVPFPPPRPATAPAGSPARSRAPFLKIAAALILLLGGGLLFRLNQGQPSLPPPVAGGPVRGGEIETLAPLGEVPAIPTELNWAPREGARAYRVRLVAVDDTVLWEGIVPAPPARLPADLAGRLHRAVTYTWTVEALDASGARIAASETARFRAKPGRDERDPRDPRDPRDE